MTAPSMADCLRRHGVPRDHWNSISAAVVEFLTEQLRAEQTPWITRECAALAHGYCYECDCICHAPHGPDSHLDADNYATCERCQSATSQTDLGVGGCPTGNGEA